MTRLWLDRCLTPAEPCVQLAPGQNTDCFPESPLRLSDPIPRPRLTGSWNRPSTCLGQAC